MISEPGQKIIQTATGHLREFMSTIVKLDESDWEKLSNDMGENEQICWQQIEMLIEYFQDVSPARPSNKALHPNA